MHPNPLFLLKPVVGLKQIQGLRFSVSKRRMNRNPKKVSDTDRSIGVCAKDMAKAAAIFLEKRVEVEHRPKKVENASSKASSIRSYRTDDDDKDFTRPDPYVSLRVADDLHSRRNNSRNEHDTSDSDPYVALRIADTRRSNGPGNRCPYAPLRIANTLHSSSKTSTSGNDGPNNGPYVPLKIAAKHSSALGSGEEVIYGANDSSGTEEDVDDSDGSTDEHLDDEEGMSEFGGDSVSEAVVDKDFSTDYARVSIAGSENEQGNDDREFPGCTRVSVAGSVPERTNAGRQFPGYSRVSVAGSEPDYGKDGDEEFPEYARVSVAGSENDYGNLHAKISRAGSKADHGKEIYARVSVVGSEIDHGQDVYARLSVAGSEAEHERGVDRDFTGYGRVSVAGSEFDYQQDICARVSVLGSDIDHGKDVYARVSVAGREEYGEDFDRDVHGYARLTVVDMASCPLDGLKSEMGHLSEKGQTFSVSESENREELELWNKEYETYMGLSREIQAKLQYRVRVVLISPLFELNEQKVSAFCDLYKGKFGEDMELTGFSSVVNLCRAMPDIVQIKKLEENGVIILVDSIKNRRAVSGIRSGLRRIVYDALRSLPSEVTCPQLEAKCSKLLGKPLMKVLTEHGYDTPKMESLVKDMPDIVGFEDAGLEPHVYLCSGAEDPALTDGLLIKSSPMNTSKTAKSKEVISDAGDTWETAKYSEHLNSERESLKIGSSVTLRSLKNELRKFGSFSNTSISSPDDEVLQVRLRMQILLAFYNSGHGIEVREVPELYAQTFGRRLDLQKLGFESLMELARHWRDIFLLQEVKPGWVFLVPSQANRRILNTFRTGLRASVFSVLVETYPEGLDPLEFLHCLQQGMSGELWEVLDATGYICSDVEKADSILSSSSSSEFQLVDFEEICVLVDDMMDFVRLGSNEDGSVVVKLRNGEVPLVDLMDCKMEEIDMRSFDELFVNLMMIAVDVTETADADDVDDCSLVNSAFINVGHVQSLVKSFEGSGGLRSAHSQSPDSLRLKHELRLILGSPQYFESGLAWNELSRVYTDRTGQELGSKLKVKSLLRAMPDIVCKDSLVGASAHLLKTPKNLRILSTTKAGFRQVLFWALVKNPGGLWANLLEGWFTDFSGMSLAATLRMHGYEKSRSRPFSPVYTFLRDMSDLLQKKSAPYEIYTWADAVQDPVHNDASLLGLSELMIQYDPLRGEPKEVSNRETGLAEIFFDKSALKDDEGDREAKLELDCILEKFPLKEDEGVAEAILDNESAVKTSTMEGGSQREARLDHHNVDKIHWEKESSRVEIYHAQSKTGDVLRGGEIEESGGDHEIHFLRHKQAGEREGDSGEIAVEFMKEDRNEDHSDIEGGGGSNSEEITEHAEESTEPFPPTDRIGKDVGDMSGCTLEAYVQLRVASKGPNVNLDEWQFTDSEDGEEDYDVHDDFQEEEEEEEEEHSKPETPNKEQGQALPAVAYVGPKVNVTGKDTIRAWVLPNKGIPWK